MPKRIKEKRNFGRDSIMWLESFLEFVELGIKLQKEGKNPRVHVSY